MEAKDGDFKGMPIWTDQRRFNRPMDLVITADGANVVVAEDDFKLAIIDKMKQAKDFGPVMEAEIAKRLADVYISDLMTPIGPSTEVPKVVGSNDSNDSDDLDESEIPEGDDDILASNDIEDPLSLG
jgi:DNA-binding beta-propeller fold protein YncE